MLRSRFLNQRDWNSHQCLNWFQVSPWSHSAESTKRLHLNSSLVFQLYKKRWKLQFFSVALAQYSHVSWTCQNNMWNHSQHFVTLAQDKELFSFFVSILKRISTSRQMTQHSGLQSEEGSGGVCVCEVSQLNSKINSKKKKRLELYHCVSQHM